MSMWSMCPIYVYIGSAGSLTTFLEPCKANDLVILLYCEFLVE